MPDHLLGGRGVDAAQAAESSGALHQVAGGKVEVGVLVDKAVGRVVVELVQSVGQESVLITRGDTELSDPDGVASLGVGLDEVVQEGLSTILTTGTVPVEVDKVNGAAAATVRQEGREPVQTEASIGAGGDGGSTNLDLALVLGEVLGVLGGSGSSIQVSLAGIVALVEAEKSLDAVGDGAGSSVVPGGVVVGRTPEHGNVVDIGGQATVGEAPVVAPAKGSAGGRDDGRDERGIVVTETTLGAGRAAAGRGASRGSRGGGGSSCGSGGGGSSGSGDSRVSAGGAGLDSGSRGRSRDNGGQSAGAGSRVGSRGDDDGGLRRSGLNRGDGVSRLGLGSSGGDKVSSRGGGGNGLVASGNGDSLPDGGDVDLSGGVDDVLLVEVSVAAGCLDGRDGKSRDNVLAQHCGCGKSTTAIVRKA